MTDLYACELCQNAYTTLEERDQCRIFCELDAMWHIYSETNGDNYWSLMAMHSYFHLTVETIGKTEDPKHKSFGSGGNYL